MKKICCFLCCFLALCSVLSACGNVNDEGKELTGYSVYSGIYIKTASGHDVLLHETDSGEEIYLFMTPAENSQTSFDGLQTGDRIRISFVIIREESGVHTTQVFELEKLGTGESPVPSETLQKVDALSQKLP